MHHIFTAFTLLLSFSAACFAGKTPLSVDLKLPARVRQHVPTPEELRKTCFARIDVESSDGDDLSVLFDPVVSEHLYQVVAHLDDHKAFDTYKARVLKLAKKGSARAQLIMGYLHQFDMRDMSFKKAMKWFEKAAAHKKVTKDVVSARYNLGVCYECAHRVDKEVTQDLDAAIDWYEAAISHGVNDLVHVEAVHRVSLLQMTHMLSSESAKGHEQQIAQNAVRGLEWAAINGSVGAMCSLGEIALTGVFGADYNAARLYYKKAISYEEVPVALHNLALLYLAGHGGKQKKEKAVSLFKRAAKCGYARSFHSLGLCAMEGTGMKKDIQRAVKYWKRADELGFAESMYNLGMLYINGDDGIESDVKAGVRYLMKAAARGSAHAQTALKHLVDTMDKMKANGEI